MLHHLEFATAEFRELKMQPSLKRALRLHEQATPATAPATPAATVEALSAERQLATVLFTDIVGSTERVAALGDREWRRLKQRHHDVVRRELARFRGREVDTAGDGFFLLLDAPARAVRCTCAIRDGVHALGLEIRAGLHLSEVEVQGREVSGIAVHVGARCLGLAGPSEVLVTQTVKDLMHGAGIGFEDCGTHQLKGVPGEWRLFRVVEAAEAD